MKIHRIIKKAKHRLELIITEENIKDAIAGDSCNCVIAKALQDKWGEIVDGVEVGPCRTKIYLDGNGTVWIYKTPPILKDHLPIFDTTGEWGLPPGKLYLLPVPKYNPDSRKRHDTADPDRRGKFTGRPLLHTPTRSASISFESHKKKNSE